MKILAVETSTRCQSVAIMDGTSVLAEQRCEDCSSHTRQLLPAIDALLKSSGFRLKSLDGLAVSLGPGSFTGLRVGLSTMMALRLAKGLPLVGVPTLEALAWNVPEAVGRICPTLKSRVGEVYWAQFEWVGGALTRLCSDQVGTMEECLESLTEQVWGLGDGWDANQSIVEDQLGKTVKLVTSGKRMPSAVSVGLASQKYFLAGDLLPIGASPRYVQLSRAEGQWKGQQVPFGGKASAR